MSAPEPRRSVSPNVIAVVIGVLAIVVIAAVGYAVANGRDAGQIIGLVGLFLAPTIAALVGLVKTDRQDGELSTIRRNTNGALEQLTKRLESLESTGAAIAEANGVTTPDGPEPPVAGGYTSTPASTEILKGGPRHG